MRLTVDEMNLLNKIQKMLKPMVKKYNDNESKDIPNHDIWTLYKHIHEIDSIISFLNVYYNPNKKN